MCSRSKKGNQGLSKKVCFGLLSIGLFLWLGVGAALQAQAEVPKLINYQGKLTAPGGMPVTDGNYNITFKLYTQPTGGSATWTETSSLPVSNGLFNIILGSVIALNLDFNQGYYLGITVGSDPEMTPRQQLTSVGYAITANNAGTATYALSANKHYIGESYGGGIVFYVYDNGQHGLISATADQGTNTRWSAGSTPHTMAEANGVGAGKVNTAIIIASQGYGDGAPYAARVCNEYSVIVGGVTYGDWYLPSKHELNLLYLQKAVVGGFAADIYWSSTEYGYATAWFQSFNNGFQNYYTYSKSSTFGVRTVRAF